MVPIKYEVVGEEDYAFAIAIESSGKYVVSDGTYSTRPPRSGQLTATQEQELRAAIAALGIPPAHPMPPLGKGFQARLIIGDEGQQLTYPFWEGALEEDAKLQTLVRLLDTI